MDESISKPCPRCGGSGRYSWCETFGDKCFQCGGTGRIVDPKKNPKAKITATLQTCQMGDVIESAHIVYRVRYVRWLPKMGWRGLTGGNQKVGVERLVDGKLCSLLRQAWDRETRRSFDPAERGYEGEVVGIEGEDWAL